MPSKTKILALIPARGGSKGIPRKNLLSLLDKPLIAWSIEHAMYSKHINRVIVSTDDEEIRDIAIKYGAEAPFIRPAEISQDLSTDLECFTHALNWLDHSEDYHPSLVVHLRPTGPARVISKIDNAISLFLENMDCDSLRSVSLADQTPYKMWLHRGNRLSPAMNTDQDLSSTPRQQLEKVYWQNGYVDIVKPQTILKLQSMTGKNVLPFIINNIKDIDYFHDIPIVEEQLKKIISGESDDEHEEDFYSV
jgi:CMP-N,N'-diacetyllegionaminic acid synthase